MTCNFPRRILACGTAALACAALAGAAVAAPPASHAIHRPGPPAGMQQIAADLKLTAAQQAKLTKLQNKMQPQIMALQQNPKLAPQQKQQKFMALVTDFRKQMMAILTPAQRAKLQADMQARHGAMGAHAGAPHHAPGKP